MKKLFRFYIDSYRGLSKPAWMLALVMLINRTGSMVLPFLGIYMLKVLDFSMKEAGIVLSCYGFGSVIGAWLGGKLTDKIGHFKVQAVSLILTFPIFFIIYFLKDMWSLAIGVFVLTLVSDTFRPANSVSVVYYAKPENITRAFSLNRMAINLGFSIGPAVGGLLAAISYKLLFYGNGVGALIAGLVFYFYFKNRKGNPDALVQHKTQEELRAEKQKSPYKDIPYLFFSLFITLYAISFFQILSTLPMYYERVYQFNEADIGLLIAFSSLVVFGLEMVLVRLAEIRYKPHSVIIAGTFITGLSFVVLNFSSGVWILYASMFLLSIGEIFAMPFMATVAIQQSTSLTRGAYMGLNTLAFSLAHIFSPFLGTRLAENFGFEVLWWASGLLCVVACFGFYFVMKKMKM